MLPYQNTRGIQAFRNVMVYIGFPKDVIEKNHSIKVTKDQVVRPKNLSKNLDSYLTVGELCRAIGGSF
jgi:ribosomal protein L13